MANTNSPSGFSPISNLNGASWNEGARQYWIPSTDTNAYYIGDLVSTVPGASNGVLQPQNVPTVGVAQITKMVAGGTPRGVIVSIPLDPAAPNTQFIPATKTHDYIITVLDDPNVILTVQANNTTVLAVTCINSFADIIVANGLSGQSASGTQIDSTTIGGNAALPIRILGLYNGDFSSYAKLVVCFNLHELG